MDVSAKAKRLAAIARRKRDRTRELDFVNDWHEGLPVFQDAAYENWMGLNRIGAIAAIRRIAAKSVLAQSYIHHIRLNVIGARPPMPTFSNVSSAKDRRKLKELWHIWACDPSVNGGSDLASVLRALIGSLLIDGRVFGILRRHEDYTCGLGVMPIERDWLADDGYDAEISYGSGADEYTGVNGVIRRPSGRVSHYAFYGKQLTADDVITERRLAGPGQPLKPNGDYGVHVVPADMVLDLYTPQNAADFEGHVSHLLPVLKKMQEVARLDDAMLRAMEITAKKMGFIERDLSSDTMDERLAENPDENPPPIEFEPNSIELLPPGYKFNSFDPSAPNAAMSEYRKEIVMNAAAALGLDHASMAGDLKDVNYSSIRHGMVMARENYKVIQREIERRVLVPMLARLLETERLRGRLSITDASLKAAVITDWRHRSWGWIDPLNDIQAMTLAVQLGVESPQRLAAAQGADYEQIMMDIAEAAADFKKHGLLFPAAKPPEKMGQPASQAPAKKTPKAEKPAAK